MKRRQFLSASIAASAVAVAGKAQAVPRQRLRVASFTRCAAMACNQGPQSKATETYFSDALIPALTRMGMGPVGRIRVEFGPETPAFYLLIPGSSVQALAELDLAPRR
jgi:hypothetical protein